MVVAVDATGLARTAASRYFVALTRNGGAERTRQHWPKRVVAVDVLRRVVLRRVVLRRVVLRRVVLRRVVLRRVVLGQLAYAGPATASASLRPVADLARQMGGRLGSS
jgi:hypothetical protein